MPSDNWMIIRFELFGTLEHLTGPNFEIVVEGPVLLRDLLGPLADRLGQLVPYGTETTEAQLLSNLSFFMGRKMLRMEDRIDADNTITVVLPATGG
ncbi:MAG: hypothetical protein SCH71_08125 [Desulfobulbaceae bacterium]|nr:hypothetical protein [Desulfobulbaceae bacterium]